MLHRFALAALLALAAAPVLAAAPPRPGLVRISLETSEGAIVLDLDQKRAPITTANFLRYVDQHRLDGTAFYRATQPAPGFGFIQGGVRFDPRRMLPGIPHEPTTKTGIKHTDGTISMARTKPGTATGDFFITVGRLTSLDANPKAKGDNLGFAAFGHVVSGMRVVRHILGERTVKTAGEGAMRGQYLAEPVEIVSARRIG